MARLNRGIFVEKKFVLDTRKSPASAMKRLDRHQVKAEIPKFELTTPSRSGKWCYAEMTYFQNRQHIDVNVWIERDQEYNGLLFSLTTAYRGSASSERKARQLLNSVAKTIDHVVEGWPSKAASRDYEGGSD